MNWKNFKYSFIGAIISFVLGIVSSLFFAFIYAQSHPYCDRTMSLLGVDCLFDFGIAIRVIDLFRFYTIYFASWIFAITLIGGLIGRFVSITKSKNQTFKDLIIIGYMKWKNLSYIKKNFIYGLFIGLIVGYIVFTGIYYCGLNSYEEKYEIGICNISAVRIFKTLMIIIPADYFTIPSSFFFLSLFPVLSLMIISGLIGLLIGWRRDKINNNQLNKTNTINN
ncbi:MAG: hypothetical protein Q8L47_01795 [bacterium]|nr:hypothetical protein [bacterium]